MNTTRRSGFTLVEISVVLVVALIISSITFGAFRSVSDGNKRTNCQSNLSQIYQSSRLYAQDYSGKFPYFNEGVPPGAPYSANTPQGGIGLWSLYTFRKVGDKNCDAQNLDLSLAQGETPATGVAAPAALTGYVRSPKIFHCPADNFDRTVRYRSKPTDTDCVAQTAKVPSGSLTFVTDGTTPTVKETRLNPAYLSYQSQDDIDNDTVATTQDSTYSTFRGSGEKRQLTYFVDPGTPGTPQTPERPTSDNTVVAWCRFHRSLTAANGQVTTNTGPRNYDNVLFYDGTVQNIPARESQTTFQPCTQGTAGCVASWRRVPKRAN